MAGLTSGFNPNLTKAGLDKVVFSTYEGQRLPNRAHADDPLLFRPETTTQGAVIDEVTMGVGLFTSHVEEQALDEATVISDDKATHTVLNWKKALPIPVEYFEDANFGHVQKTMRDFGRAARETQDKNAVEKYVQGLAGTFTTNNGVALFSNSQNTIGGATIDNLETGALTEPNLEILVNALLNQKGQDGTLAGHSPAFLLVPTALFKEAMEITKSNRRAQVTDNDMNYYSAMYPGLKVVYSPYMGAAFSGVDTYYVLGSSFHTMTRAIRIPFSSATTKLVGYEQDSQDRYIYKARFREVVYASTFEGLVGSQGTT